jgi:serine/threonine-protein kinase
VGKTSAAPPSTVAASVAVTQTASSTDPAGATALCKDGSYSFSKTASGTCSNHGGVGRWINRP